MDHPKPIPQPALAPRRTRRGRVWRRLCLTFLALAVLLVAARLYLPTYLRSYVNGIIDQSPDYDGGVGEIDVHLWRGAYSIHDLKIVKRIRSVSVPFFEGERVDFSLDWKSLMHGQARGKIVMEKPRLNFVHGPTAEETQTGAEQPWLTIMDDLFPFRIDKAEIKDGEIHFRAFHTKPPFDVYLSKLQATITNLTNVENKLDLLIATVHAEGMAMESGRFELDMSLNPQAHRPAFNIATRLLDLDVTTVNNLALAYGDFDFKSGRFDLVVEASTEDGYVVANAKPLFRNVQVFSLRDIGREDPLQMLWEALVGVVGEVFTNQSRDQFGTSITFEGDLDNPRTNIIEIIGNVLYNAFVRAYLPRIEGRIAPELVKPGNQRRKGGSNEKP